MDSHIELLTGDAGHFLHSNHILDQSWFSSCKSLHTHLHTSGLLREYYRHSPINHHFPRHTSRYDIADEPSDPNPENHRISE